MATALPLPLQPGPMDWTVADVQQRLDDIPAERIRTFPESRTARIFTSPRRSTLVDENGPLDAGSVLPGFELSLKEWFSRAHRRVARRKKK